MAFKMNGWSGWQNQNSGALSKAKTVAPNKAESRGPMIKRDPIDRLTKKEAKLKGKLEGTAEGTGKHKRLSQRHGNVSAKLEEKKQIASNISENKAPKANVTKKRDRNLLVADLKSEKQYNEEGSKANVERSLTTKGGKNIQTSVKVKDKGKTIAKSVTTGEKDTNIKKHTGFSSERAEHAFNNPELKKYTKIDKKTGNVTLNKYQKAWDSDKHFTKSDGKRTDEWGKSYSDDDAGYQQFVTDSEAYWAKVKKNKKKKK